MSTMPQFRPHLHQPTPLPAVHLSSTDTNGGLGLAYPPTTNATQKPQGVARDMTRTPSPTPSEIEMLDGGGFRRGLRAQSTRQLIQRYLVILIIVAVIVVIEVYHDKIIDGLKPVTNWLHDLKGGWVIPIIVLIALSFPPLFGHEVVAMLCGLVWGLGQGFGIVAAGTILGEILTFYVFRYLCGQRGAKLEGRNANYALLAHTIRHGGLTVAIIARYSALPGHLTTAVFSAVGMPFWVFLVAAVVSLPKQFAVVYIGYALAADGDSESNKIQKIVLAITVVVTVIAMVYMRYLMNKARPEVVYARRKMRQARALEVDVETGEAGRKKSESGDAVAV
ncbi:hypothetical protein MKEN_00166100 [Mycena kentingensis (nom. inval.)]|nr:hypothetical protein MKEN_00166100 [Mycena kentingensis (nom. inval.)]